MVGLRIQLLCWTFLIFTIPILQSEDSAVETGVWSNDNLNNGLGSEDVENGTSVLSRHVRDATGGNNETTSPAPVDDNDPWGDIMQMAEGSPFLISTREDVCEGCPDDWRNTTLKSEGWNWIWAAHVRNNYFRRLHGLPDLLLNMKLCKCAQMWADKQVAGKRGHSGWCMDNGLLGGGGIGRWWPDFPATRWYSEISKWSFDKGAQQTPWGWEVTGHFVQIVMPVHRYHCTIQANSATATSGIGMYDSPYNKQPGPEHMSWIYPPKTLKELFGGTGKLNGSVEYVLLLLITGTILMKTMA